MAQLFSASEARTLARLGLPILLAQLAQIGMNFVDTVMAGRFSAQALAGIAVASSFWMPTTLFAVGCLMALPGMEAQLVGAQRPARAAHLLRQGMALALVLACLVIALLWQLSLHLDFFGLDAELEPVTRGYLQTLLPGVPAFFLFVCLRSYLEGYGRTRPAMVIGVACLLLNIPCNYIFIYGHMGVPAMGGVGCGIATTICFWFMALAMAFHLCRNRDLGGIRLFLPSRAEREREGCPLLDWPLLGQVMRVGLPSAVAVCVEVTLFSVTALLLAPLGTIAVAGHQVTMNYASLVFCLPMSINMVATIRVGYNLGADQKCMAIQSAHTMLAVGAGLALLAMAVTMIFRGPIIGLYTEDAPVSAVAMELMLLCGGYQLMDSMQNISAGILRGYNDTRFVSLICLVSYGILGIGAGVVLGRTDWLVPAMGAAGFWAGYILALAGCAACYLARMHWLHKRPMEEVRKKLAQ